MFLLKQIVFQTLTKPEPKQKTWPAQNQTKQKLDSHRLALLKPKQENNTTTH